MENNNTVRTKLIENLVALDIAQKVAEKALGDAEDRNCDKTEWNLLLSAESAVIAQWNRLHDMLTIEEKLQYQNTKAVR